MTFRIAFVAATLLVVGYVLVIATDTILWFVREAGALALQSVRVCGAMVVIVVGVLLAWLLLRQQYERNRQRDGAWAVREYWIDPLPKRVMNWLRGRPSARAVYDHNNNPSFGAVICDNVYQVAVAPEQYAYALAVEQTNRVRAAAPGDAVLGMPWASVGRGIGGIANAATGRYLAGAYNKEPKPITIDATPSAPQLPPPAPLTPQEAVQESRPASLVLGQTDSGELVRWDMTQTPHLRFHGATRGAGKTNAIQTVAAGALKTGAHVVVFDPARLKDWQDFAHCAELVDTAEPATLADGAARLMTIYHNRTRQLAQAGARDVSHMTRPPRRIVVIIAEFGAQCEMARAEGVMADIETPLLQLARKAAATGIYLLFEDQAVEHWPRVLAANAAPVIGRMPLYAAQACGFVPRRDASTETIETGQFWFGGQLIQTPHMEPALRTLLADVPAPRALVMLTPPWRGEAGSSQPVHGGANSPVQEQFTAVHTRVAAPPPAPVNYTPTTVEGWYEWTIDNYLPAHPELLQTDDRGRGMGVKALAETMAVENGKDLDAMKGTASEVAKRIREAAYLPSGAKLGVDTTSIPGGSVVQ